MKTISYLRPKGTFSEQAAMKFAGKLEKETALVDLPSLEAVAKSVSSGNNDFGIMAVYNYLEGLVQECLDLVYENNLKIIGMERIPIEFSIGQWKESKDLENVGNIYSHPKGLAQCSEFLQKHYPDSNQVAVSSTAEAAKLVSEKKAGLAIASRNALALNGLEIIASDIGNKRHDVQNHTDFYVVTRNDAANDYKQELNNKDCLTMVALIPHFDKVGLLNSILTQIEYYGLNIAKVHSRPALDEIKIDNGKAPQMFYLEMEAHPESDAFKRCAEAIRWKLMPQGKDIEVVRILGSYKMPDAE